MNRKTMHITRKSRRMSAGRVLLLAGWAAAGWVGMAATPCRIEIREEGTGWPVPLVELRTTHEVRFHSDNAGVIAFDLPELMGIETWLGVRADGYEVAADGFGYRGVRLVPEPGRTHEVRVRRTGIARRLGRLTGAGLFAEDARTGGEPWGETGVLGCDTVQVAAHRGRLYWTWGDTTLARHPLGIFHMTGAVTPLRPLERFEPPLRLRYGLFRDGRGRPRALAPLPGDGPTWLGGMVSLPDVQGESRLVAAYVKIDPPLDPWEAGLCVWDEAEERFERHRVVWTRTADAPRPPPMPDGHAVRVRDAGGADVVLFGNPFPTLRIPARFEAWTDPAQWERLEPQRTVEIAGGGGTVRPHSGSVAWHAGRGRWVSVFMERFGKPSAFGELWYAEAREPTGPWGPAVKVLSHENYTFYNPRVHAELTPGDSQVLLFEGTYTRQFADRPQVVPRHDYNQVLYRLDLDDPALAPARVP